MRVPGYRRIENRLNNLRLRKAQKNHDFDPLNNFLVFADPRGGSTWVTELLKELTASPIIWEPLAVDKVPEFEQLNFSWRQFIPENEDWPEAYAVLNRIFAGQNLNYWLASKTSIAELSAASQLLVKFCRGNQLLPWITKNFNLRYKPVYLVRHPFAVVASQLKHGGWEYSFNRYKIPESKYNDVYTRHAQFLASLKTKEEALTATWCLCNSVPLKHPANNTNWLTLNYEEFLLNPEKSFARIASDWGLRTDSIRDLNFNKPSATTVPGSPIKGNNQIENWLKSFSADQVNKMERVLDYFEIEDYSRDPYPHIIHNYGKKGST